MKQVGPHREAAPRARGASPARLAAIVAAAAAMAACSGGGAPKDRTAARPPATAVLVVATPTTLAADVATAEPGWLRVTFRNATDEPRGLALARVEGTGIPGDVVGTWPATPPAAMRGALLHEGGVALVPGRTSRVFMVEAFAGSHVFASSSGDGRTATAALTVGEGKAPLADPETDARVLIQDFTFVADARMRRSGRRSVTIANDGPTRHELRLYRVKDGNEPGQVLDSFRGLAEPPAETASLRPVAGAAAMDPPFRTVTDLDLRPGSYVMACFVKGDDGRPHASIGMAALLVVT